MLTGSLNTQVVAPHSSSLHALDWLNFFLAALLTGFGPFIAVHLASRGWDPAHIGFVLSVGSFAGLITQIPGGELIDITKARRLLGWEPRQSLAEMLPGIVSDYVMRYGPRMLREPPAVAADHLALT